ncbi:hypothetical protein Acr_00g0059660 [Actinidia rufa]|uniref:Uncharacterized protein n=1 Tax=Actinidia rufa TaxID=165716 RepID=A0A7J0DNE8_9ERIC|nr:hypothetical protein Acr_00g0059660 [Actinidia rufa]
MSPLLKEMKLHFSAKDLLPIYIVVQPRMESDTPFLAANYFLHLKDPHLQQTRLVTNDLDKDLFLDEFDYGLNDRFKCRSKDCEDAIQAINNRRAPRKIIDILGYEPFYWHMIPLKNEEFGRVMLLSLCTEGRAPRRDNFSLQNSRAGLNANLPPPEFKARKRAMKKSLTRDE